MEKGALQQEIDYLCRIKASEFSMLGYEGADAEDIWDCVSRKYKELPPLHRLTNDILSLKPDRWMNWLTIQAYKGDLFGEKDK
ncbi:post-transcriptional regulator [Aneurinibacillus terranovensis]|uniref:post-transcriptional regulator n=1 Tax=Aneurinibacillus terranovensis TaxID=278991 RepID=UPI00041B1E8E|nr:post-transcriptional regulator [Aneurinibacillus terranovensis]